MKMNPKSTSIEEGKIFLRENIKNGTTCPCCNQHVQMYDIKFSSNMAIFLISLVKQYEIKQQPIHYKDCAFSSNNYPYLRHWGLMETSTSETTDKKTSGYWTPTERGISFANNEIKVPKTLSIYNNKVYAILQNKNNHPITIEEALTTKFDYKDLRNG